MRRWVLLLSLALFWVNYALTSRWADIVGSIHGSKEPIFLVILTIATLAALRGWSERDVPRWFSPAVFAAGGGLLIVSFFRWFPPATWNQLPFLDNWATRFQVTVEGLELYGRGVATGWRWAFLGGYPTSTDISQTLSTIGAVPANASAMAETRMRRMGSPGRWRPEAGSRRLPDASRIVAVAGGVPHPRKSWRAATTWSPQMGPAIGGDDSGLCTGC